MMSPPWLSAPALGPRETAWFEALGIEFNRDVLEQEAVAH